MKRVRIACVLSVMLLLLEQAFPALAQEHPGTPYYITAYDITVDVAEDNILHITEDIDVFFNEPRHGIFRYIPKANRVERADGSVDSTRAKISGIRCSEEYSTSSDSSELTLQIGSEDKTLTGAHSYRLSYYYELGQDVLSGADELYYNLIGDGWDTFVDNVTFTVNMPKEFSSSAVGFSTGSYGFSGTDSIEYYVDGLTVSGRLTRELGPYEAFTVRIELPDGYFYFNKTAHIAKLCAVAGLPVIVLVIVAVIWRRFGKDKRLIAPVEFYPPKGMSSADAAYWYKGAISDKDLVALLIELANEGFIAINEKKSGEYYDGSDYYIERLATYNGDDYNKKLFFDGLFEGGRTTVTAADLENEFYKTLQRISLNYNTYENRRRVFSNTSLWMRVACWALIALCAVGIVLIFNATLGGNERYFALVFGLVVLAGALVLSFFVRRRTDKGHELLEKITGFKNFLETAEKDRLEKLVFDDPKYFYGILPYAYVLGVSDEWVKKFEDIAMEPPEWYRGYGGFNTYMMWHFMSRTMESAAQAMTSAPQTSSGGGGGFAGGGSGGGGGGSW